MKVRLIKKPENLDNVSGRLIVFRDKIRFSKTKDFDTLISEMSKKDKISKTDLLGEGVQLYCINTEEFVSIFENREVDLFRLRTNHKQILDVVSKLHL